MKIDLMMKKLAGFHLTHRGDKIQCQHSLFTIRFIITANRDCLFILPSTWMSLYCCHLFCCIIEKIFLQDFFGFWANQSIVKQFCRHKVSFASSADWNAISVIHCHYCLSSVTNLSLQIDFPLSFARSVFDTNQLGKA